MRPAGPRGSTTRPPPCCRGPGPAGRARAPFDDIDEIDDFESEGRRGLGQRTKLALLIGAVAAVVVIGLAIGYAVLGIGAQPGTVPSTSSSVDPNSPPPTDPSPLGQ